MGIVVCILIGLPVRASRRVLMSILNSSTSLIPGIYYQGPLPENMQYDGAYTLTSPASSPVSSRPVTGPFLSNGKIGIILRADAHGASDVFITGDMTPKLGVYENNIIPGIHSSHTHLFAIDEAASPGISMESFQMSLAMDTGIATLSYDIYNNQTVKWATFEQDVYVHRMLPFICVQTVRVSFTNEYLQDATAPTPCIFHEMIAPSTLVNATFTTNTLAIANSSNQQLLQQQQPPLHMLCCSANLASDSSVQVASTVTYLFDSAIMRNGGHNVYRANRSQAFNRIDFISKSTLEAQKVYKIHMITAMASSHDLPQTADTLQRMILNIVQAPSPSPNSTAMTEDIIAMDIRSKHVAGWMALWKGNLVIEAKDDASPTEALAVLELKKAVRIALYNVYSCTRPGVSVEINPTNISLVDRDGSIMYDGDLFFIPLLLLMNPDLSRSILQQRYKSLSVARQLAAGFGNRGAKFPYINDVAGFTKTLYWDTVSPVNVFNTPLVSISVWNYYRSTRDFDWLKETGYDILRNVADYIVSIATLTDSDVSPGGAQYTIANVSGPSAVKGSSNTFTNYLCATALRYTIEASYELSLPIKPAWSTVYSGMFIPEFSETGILKFDALGTEEFGIAEPLLLMTPYLDSLFFETNRSRGPNTLDAALSFYKDRTTVTDHPYNLLARALLLSRVAQTLPVDQATERITEYESILKTFLSKYSSQDAWGNLSRSPTMSKVNDVTMSAIFLLMILMGPVGFRIQGGVTDTRFYYQEMQIVKNPTARMPSSWKRVMVYGFGSAGYTGTAGGSVGFAGYAGFSGYSSYSGVSTIMNWG